MILAVRVRVLRLGEKREERRLELEAEGVVYSERKGRKGKLNGGITWRLGNQYQESFIALSDSKGCETLHSLQSLPVTYGSNVPHTIG
jgi:hypothetical protein